MTKSRPYSADFFDLQLRFAARVAAVSGLLFFDAVGSYTNLYVRLAMGPCLDVMNPEWLTYFAGMTKASDPRGWTHQVHRQRLHLPVGTPSEESVGCFSYARAGPGLVRLHFNTGDDLHDSPLSDANQSTRQGELAALLARLKAWSGDSVRVLGASWLYNLSSYRRLFPEPYLAGLRPIEHPYQRMPLWGQFLNRDRTVRPQVGPQFLADIANASSLTELAACFPYSVLATSAPAQCLYEHLGY